MENQRKLLSFWGLKNIIGIQINNNNKEGLRDSLEGVKINQMEKLENGKYLI